MIVFKQNTFLFNIGLIIFIGFHGTVNSQDIPDRDFMEQFDQIITRIACEASSQTTGSAMKVNINRYATREEMAKLAFWNYGVDFKKTKLEFDEDLKWKRDLVDVLFDIFKASCPTEAVPHQYINIFRELIMIYFNSAEPRGTNNTMTWETIQRVFTQCKDGLKPYNLLYQSMQVTGISGQRDDMIESVDLYPPADKVDEIFEFTDMVIDNFWWVFSHAVGQCYKKMPRVAILAPKIKALFVRDILRPLMNRWGDPGPIQDFGPVVGNFNINRVQRNLRYCVTAAYLINGLTELQMVRPLRVGYRKEGLNSVQNRKTGIAISK